MLKVGLSGGIGSGKTTVADLFAELGVPVIDTDAISHQLGNTQEVIDKVRKTFGDEVIGADGGIDRKALAAIVFSDEKQREKLEQIMHPRIRECVNRALANIKDAPYAIVVVPLLLETDYHENVDRILIVDAPEDEQVRRVQQRDQRDADAIRAIMDNQLDRRERLRRADDVISNHYRSDYLRQLKTRVNDLDQLYRELGSMR